MAGSPEDFTDHLFYDVHRHDSVSLDNNSTMRQLALTQAKLSVSQAIYDFVVAKAELEQTLGYDFIDE